MQLITVSQLVPASSFVYTFRLYSYLWLGEFSDQAYAELSALKEFASDLYAELDEQGFGLWCFALKRDLFLQKWI